MNQVKIRLSESKEIAEKIQALMIEKKWSAQKVGIHIFEEYFKKNSPKSGKGVSTTRFTKPTWEEVAGYFYEQGSQTCQDDATRFIDYYEANGWKVGKNAMKDWKATVRTWIKRKKDDKQSGSKAISGRDAITFRNTDF